MSPGKGVESVETMTSGTRAVIRQIEPGNTTTCAHCGTSVKFAAKTASDKRKKVVANVYGRDGDPEKWDRVEQFHIECYSEACEPYGSAV